MNYDGNPLKLLTDSICNGLEERQRGAMFPLLHEYAGVMNNDFHAGQVEQLKKELIAVKQAFGGLELGILEGEEFKPVHQVVVQAPSHLYAYSSLPAVPVEEEVRKEMALYIEFAIGQCDEAIKRNCGFGKYEI